MFYHFSNFPALSEWEKFRKVHIFELLTCIYILQIYVNLSPPTELQNFKSVTKWPQKYTLVQWFWTIYLQPFQDIAKVYAFDIVRNKGEYSLSEKPCSELPPVKVKYFTNNLITHYKLICLTEWNWKNTDFGHT